jgi:hypothetical protein
MEKKHYAIIGLVAVILVIGTVEVGYGWMNLFFDQVPYNYTSTVTIPPNSPNGSSLSGTYWIGGKGRDFQLFLILPGAQQGESPLDYTSDGMTGKGHIDNIQISWSAISNLLSKNFKAALLATSFNGTLDVSCASWTGKVFFYNNGKEFPANFTIDGPLTDWEGGFNVSGQGNRLVISADYIYYPTGQKNTSTPSHVKKDYYF